MHCGDDHDMVTKTKEQETDVVFESPLKVNIALLQNGTSKSHFLTRDSNARKKISLFREQF